MNIKCSIVGKDLYTYKIPKVIRILCSCEEINNCSIVNKDITLSISSKLLLFIKVPVSRNIHIIKDILGLQCKIRNYEVIEYYVIDRIFISDIVSSDADHTTISKLPFSAFYINSGFEIDINKCYEFEGINVIEPYTQSISFIFTKATLIKSDVDSFILTKDVHSMLKCFNIEHNNNVQIIFDYLYNLYESYAYNITRIYGRFDIHLVTDLMFKSVISYKFDNDIVNEAWLDVLIVGDTRIGKGEVCENLLNYFGVGDIISGDMCTIVGLIGAVRKISDTLVITWGKIPQNDRGLLIIDEKFKLNEAIWSQLTRIRSKGIAEITKSVIQKAYARTRLLFICNPNNQSVSSYSYGIQAVPDIVKSSEDISRFDFVLIVSEHEVDVNEMNKSREPVKSIHTREEERALIMWTWSRDIDDIIFSDAAIQAVYNFSIKLANVYTAFIPLIQGSNIRVKLTKLAICFAARLYSNKNNGRKLFIDEIHVRCAYFFLILYTKRKLVGTMH